MVRLLDYSQAVLMDMKDEAGEDELVFVVVIERASDRLPRSSCLGLMTESSLWGLDRDAGEPCLVKHHCRVKGTIVRCRSNERWIIDAVS